MPLGMHVGSQNVIVLYSHILDNNDNMALGLFVNSATPNVSLSITHLLLDTP
jgi:hypothetical protein